MSEEQSEKATRKPSLATQQTRAFRAVAAAKEAVAKEDAKFERQTEAHKERSEKLERELAAARKTYWNLTGAEAPL